MYLSAKELAGFIGLPSTVQNINAKAKRENWLAKERQSVGGGKEYHISALPINTQTAIYKKLGKVKVGEQLLDLPKPKEVGTYCREALWANWSKTTEKAKQEASQRLNAVKAVFALVQNGTKKMEAYRAVSEQFNLSLAGIRRHCASVRGIDESDWAPALLPKQYLATSEPEYKERRRAYITPEAWNYFKGDYLRLEKPALKVSYARTKDAAKEHGWVIPSVASLSRRLEQEVPHQQRVLMREGEHALHQLYPPQQRTVEDLHALEWINGDGYQHNVFVRWFNGEIIRPKTWFWADVYSRKILGWRCDISENSDSIRFSLMDVCEKYGIPKEITLDNTRAAANKGMTGSVPNRYRFKVKDDDPMGIIPLLGIKLHWTSVINGRGHGQAKPIERAFGVGGVEEYVDKHPLCAGAYTGANPTAKPDNYGSTAIDAEVFLKAIAQGVEMYNAKQNRQTEICQGFMSFDEAFNSSYEHAVIRKATPDQLRMMMLQAEPVRVNKHGTITLKAGGNLKGKENRYGNVDAMYQYIDQKVVARFDPMALHTSVEIYTLNGVHICTAPCIDKSGFGDTQAAREHKRKRTQFVKANKAAAEAHKTMTALEVAEKMKPLDEEFIPEAKVVEPIRPTISIGNTAVKAQAVELEEEEEDFESNYSASVAYLAEQRKQSRL